MSPDSSKLSKQIKEFSNGKSIFVVGPNGNPYPVAVMWRRIAAQVVDAVTVFSIAFLRWNKGQTPAMDLLKVSAVRTKNGQHLGIIRCVGRWLIDGASWLVPPIVLGGLAVNTVSYLPASVDRRRHTVADRLAGTTIIAYDRDKEAQHPG